MSMFLLCKKTTTEIHIIAMHNNQNQEVDNNLTEVKSITVPPEDSVNPIHIWITVSTMIAIILIGILANSMLIIAVYRTARLQNVTNTFVVNLSVCDMLFVTVILPFNIYTYIQQGWFLNDEICQAVGFLAYTLTGTTLMTISIIAWVRYQVVTNHNEFKTRFSRRNIYLMLVATWILPALCQIPAMIGMWGKFGFVPIMVSCNLLLDHSSQSFKVFLLLSRAIVPSALVIYCYLAINYTTRKSHNKLKSSQGQRIQRTNLQNKISKKEMRLTRITSLLFIVFALSYFPCTISGMVDWNSMLSKTFHLYCQLSLYIGSFFNPLVYGLLNRQFRKVYIKMFQSSSSFTEDNPNIRKEKIRV